MAKSYRAEQQVLVHQVGVLREVEARRRAPYVAGEHQDKGVAYLLEGEDSIPLLLPAVIARVLEGLRLQLAVPLVEVRCLEAA